MMKGAHRATADIMTDATKKQKRKPENEKERHSREVGELKAELSRITNIHQPIGSQTGTELNEGFHHNPSSQQSQYRDSSDNQLNAKQHT